MKLVDQTGKSIETTPKLVETREIKLLMHIYEDNTMRPDVEANGMDKFELHFWISKFQALVAQ